MNQLFEIIDINNSTIIVIGKTYCGIDYYISELEINDIVMAEGIIGVVYKDKIQIINL